MVQFFRGAQKILLLLLTGMTAFTAHAESWDGTIARGRDGVRISWNELITELSQADNIVLGEHHYVNAIQQKQAEIIRGVVAERGAQTRFTTAWEFLNVSDQARTRTLFAHFVAGKISAIELLAHTQGGDSTSYAPILEATKELGGEFIGVNLSRAEKKPVTEKGLAGADPALVPPGFEMGSPGYRERFVETMQDHVPSSRMENYYTAQCLTDDVMAYHLTKTSAFDLRFLVVGSFHSDFGDGTVGRIKARAPRERTIAIRLVDASAYTEKDLRSLVIDPKYGPIGDYVVFVNEPAKKGNRWFFIEQILH